MNDENHIGEQEIAAAAMEDGALYFGRVVHHRLKPVEHRFQYRVFSMLIDLDRIDQLARRLKWFSRGRFNLFSFHDRDYGDGEADNSSLACRIRDTLAAAGVRADGRVELLCYPRILGYAFNPLAVYYCRRADGRLAAMIYEVRNTFGGKHSYIIPCADGSPDQKGRIAQSADKRFHVSPFMEMETRYHFRLRRPERSVSVAIHQTDAEGPVFNACFKGVRRPLNDRELCAAFFAYPLMTVKVIAGIHWEAVRLLAKGMKLLPAGPEPATAATVVREKSHRLAAGPSGLDRRAA